MTDNILKLQNMINISKNIVFFGGAGVSTESGIPDFRSVDGLYHQQFKYEPEIMLSHSFFKSNPEDFFDFYRKKLLCPHAKPNQAHLKLAEMEKKHKLKAVITQNIDGLHQKAGSKNVFELHGSVLRNYCVKCGNFFDLDFMLKSTGIPYCSCGGIIKPDVVLYEESLNSDTINKTVNAISQADMLIIAGTSLSVYPAASFIDFFKGNYLVVINKSEISADSNANLVIHQNIAETLSKINI